jgi:putative DNA primase/helicase
VRVIDLPADAGAGFGIFEDLRGYNRARDLADHLKAAAARNYGHASRDFLEKLTNDLQGSEEYARQTMQEWLSDHVSAEADGQVHRVGGRFALFAAAGELATKLGTLPWTPGEAKLAAASCYEDWLDQRGGGEAQEVRRGAEAIRDFLLQHGSTRFPDWKDVGRVINQAGVRKGDRYFVFPGAFREALTGLDVSTVTRALAARGLMDLDGTKPKVERCPDPRRVYVVSKKILEF